MNQETATTNNGTVTTNEEDTTMTKKEFVTYLIQHAETFPELSDLDLPAAEHLLSLLDPADDHPAMTAQELMRTWNLLIHDPAVMSGDEPSNTWYAVMTDREDDWGTGSYDLGKAKAMARDQRGDHPQTMIAVIDNSDMLNPVCLEEITDF